KTLGEIDRIVFSDDFTLEEKAQKGAEFLDELRTQDFKDLHPDQKDSLVNVVGAKVNGLQTQLAEIQSKKTLDQTRQISNLKVKSKLGIEKPEDLMEETETLFNNGLITGGERTSIITDILKGQQGKADIANNDAEVAKKISGDNAIILDQKTVDDYYERNVQEQIAGLPPSVKIAEQALLVERLK
ncbi:MAG: hypothetical protein GY820_22895, partial [Gammaproteobacteria bacterium]|nr:hypothetical protein [Gammaproteobacteria bacterium]